MSHPRHPRHVTTRVLSLTLFLLAACTVGSLAQPPEIEDPKAKLKKKIAVPDDPRPAAGPGDSLTGSNPDGKLDELARAATEATNPALKELFTRYVVPFDKLTDTKGTPSRVKPVPLFRGDKFPANFGVTELDGKNQPGEARNVAYGELKRFDYFEELALADVDQLLKYKPLGPTAGPDGLTADDQLAAAEKLLTAVLRFHTFARERNIRQGKGWDAVRTTLTDRLRDVRVRQFQRVAAASDWLKARELGTKLLTAYPQDAAVAKEVAAVRVAEAELLMKSADHADKVRARELLDEFEARFPGGGNEAARKLRAQLNREALQLFDYARGKKGADDLVAARDALRKAELLDPTLPGLRDLQRELKTGYPILYVAARQFPERLSPATARFDSEKQCVELLFEGLLEEVPDESGGVRYRPGVAFGLPGVFPSGREFALRTYERGPDGRGGFDSADVIATVKLLRGRPDTWNAAGLAWLDDLPAPVGSTGVRITFRQGHPDPQSLLTTKMLPARWLTELGKPMDDAEFAARPFGTGPFRVYALPAAGIVGPRELSFIDNPAYGRWKDRTGLPLVREIRMVEYPKVADPVSEFKNDRLHIIPDATPQEIERFMSPSSGVLGKMQIVLPANTRRVHILAVNHRRPQMQMRDLRKGLCSAIDRDAILADVFRTGRPEHQKITAAMSGPYPPSSWATVKNAAGISTPLVNRDDALVRLRNYLNSAAVVKNDFILLYPDDNPQAKAACEKIKAQVEGLFKDAPDGKKLILNLEGVSVRELFRRVEEEHRYDLAYVPFDYPDDWYPFGLAAMLDPTAGGRGGRNFPGFGLPETNPDQDEMQLGRWLAELRAHRDYSGKIAPRAAEVHRLFNDCVPFIPLWQLDRPMIVNTAVKVFVEDTPEPVSPRVLNPTVLFQGVARWRLQ